MKAAKADLHWAWLGAVLALLGPGVTPAAAQTTRVPAPVLQPPPLTQVQGPVVIDADVYYGYPPETQSPHYPPPGYEYPGMWDWTLLPDGLIYHSYLAGPKESRMAAQLFYDSDVGGWLLDGTLGGRVGLLRYGTVSGEQAEGWQLDLEAAAFPRIDFNSNWDLVSADFRAGLIQTYGLGAFQFKFGYYHLSSHLGDEYMVRFPDAERINYARDSLVLGVSYFITPALRIYSEAAWAFYTDGGAEPWEFQAGVSYSPVEQTGLWGAPFWAVNGLFRQENDFGGNLVAQTGWQWRGQSGHLLRTGVFYFNGKSNQLQFFNTSEQQLGLGLWYDF